MDRRLIEAVAATHGLSPRLLRAQVQIESSGRADAFRYEHIFYTEYIADNPAAKAARFGPLAACSFGPLQIMLETACEIGFTGQPWDLFDPAIGLEWGASYFALLLGRNLGDYAIAFAQYNGGKTGNAKPPLRNQSYVDKVMRLEKTLAE